MPEQPEHSPALDSLYEALSEVKQHLDQHADERKDLLSQIESTERDLMEQRDAAAKAGERDTYDQLSEQLAQLTKAYRVASEDPDTDPLDEYQWDETNPQEDQHDPQPRPDRSLPTER